ncbi:MAG: GAP family protein [Chloroflexi bacterium]|jgi:hypothetical protein|nr:GAP family protein [Chloroflexota bacterium]
MNDLWTTLLPLILGSALVPAQIVVTILLLRSRGGRIVAVAWIAGMTVARLAQGVVFGLVLDVGSAGEASDEGGWILSSVLLVLAVVLYATAAKELAGGTDEDAPPPKWMSMVEGVTPGRAFLLGAGLVLIGAKLWVFTLGALGAIGDAGLGQPAASVAFVIYVALAQGILIGVVGMAYLLPTRADAILDRIYEILERYNRAIMIAVGLVFGTWFMVMALEGLGVL